MTEEQFIARYGARLQELLGPDYRNHRAYPNILRQVEDGRRTVPNILADLAESDGITSSDMSRWRRSKSGAG